MFTVELITNTCFSFKFLLFANDVSRRTPYLWTWSRLARNRTNCESFMHGCQLCPCFLFVRNIEKLMLANKPQGQCLQLRQSIEGVKVLHYMRSTLRSTLECLNPSAYPAGSFGDWVRRRRCSDYVQFLTSPESTVSRPLTPFDALRASKSFPGECELHRFICPWHFANIRVFPRTLSSSAYCQTSAVRCQAAVNISASAAYYSSLNRPGQRG